MIFDFKLKNGLVVGLETGDIVLQDAYEAFIMHAVTLHLGPLEFVWMWLKNPEEY